MTDPSAPARSSGLSITSLALAMVAAAVFCSVAAPRVLGVRETDDDVAVMVAAAAAVILGMGAVVTGVIARRRVRRGQAGRGGVALAGIVLGALVVTVPAIAAAWLRYVFYAQYQEFEQCIKGPESAYPRYLCLKECPGILDWLCRKEIGW